MLTGSGSSLYAGECLSPALQGALGMPVHAVSAGEVLTDPAGCLADRVPSLMVSFARSGNSPESCGAVDAVLESLPQLPAPRDHLQRAGAARHLVPRRPAGGHGGPRRAHERPQPRDDEQLHEHGAGGAAAGADSRTWTAIATRVSALARLAADLLLGQADALARIARSDYRTAVYLGSGNRYGAAREAALKMLEMTGGQVKTFPETYLGLRHGPMCAIDDDALVVCFLSSDPVTRAYEVDLVRELNRKKLGARKVIVGPGRARRPRLRRTTSWSTRRAWPASRTGTRPCWTSLVGQLLAFFRCLHIGLRPDAPSDEGVISRVVGDFAIHRRR